MTEEIIKNHIQDNPTQYAGFWIRFGAHILDGVFTQIVLTILMFMFFFFFAFGTMLDVAMSEIDFEKIANGEELIIEEELQYSEGRELTPEEKRLIIVTTVITLGGSFLLVLLYYVIMTASNRFKATLGKYVLDLEVRDLNGHKIGYLRSFWRYFFSFISLILAAFTFGLPYIIIAFNSKKRALHDFMVGTVVVRKYS